MSKAAAKLAAGGSRVLSYAGALLETMDAGMAEHPNVFIMGQGVDDFKGIFGSTTGLAEKYGVARVFDTPLMEEGMTGIAIGAALVGDYPITTHIRADFAFLAMNQIINLASKYRYMFGGLMRCPMLIRVVVGRRSDRALKQQPGNSPKPSLQVALADVLVVADVLVLAERRER